MERNFCLKTQQITIYFIYMFEEEEGRMLVWKVFKNFWGPKRFISYTLRKNFISLYFLYSESQLSFFCFGLVIFLGFFGLFVSEFSMDIYDWSTNDSELDGCSHVSWENKGSAPPVMTLGHACTEEYLVRYCYWCNLPEN